MKTTFEINWVNDFKNGNKSSGGSNNSKKEYLLNGLLAS